MEYYNTTDEESTQPPSPLIFIENRHLWYSDCIGVKHEIGNIDHIPELRNSSNSEPIFIDIDCERDGNIKLLIENINIFIKQIRRRRFRAYEGVEGHLESLYEDIDQGEGILESTALEQWRKEGEELLCDLDEEAGEIDDLFENVLNELESIKFDLDELYTF